MCILSCEMWIDPMELRARARRAGYGRVLVIPHDGEPLGVRPLVGELTAARCSPRSASATRTGNTRSGGCSFSSVFFQRAKLLTPFTCY